MVLVQGRAAGAETRAGRAHAPVSMASTNPLCQVLQALKGIRQGETAFEVSARILISLIFGECEAGLSMPCWICVGELK